MTRRHARNTGTKTAITIRSMVTAACLFAPSASAFGDPPVNDDCVDASIAIGGDNSFTTIDATTDGNPDPLCLNAAVSQIDADVWFKYLADCTGNLTASICGAPFDSRIAIYDGCDPGLCPRTDSPLACDDDFCNPNGASQVTIPVIDRQCYLIRIGGLTLGELGEGTLSLSCVVPTGACCNNGICLGTLTDSACTSGGGTSWVEGAACPAFACPIPPPPNDECVNCSVVFTDTPVNGTTFGATGTDITSCSSLDDSDTWHCWTADCTGTVTISLCNPDPSLAAPMPDPTLAVFDACGGAELECDDDGCGPSGLYPEISLPVTIDTEYRIRVSYFVVPKEGGISGDYTLEVSDCEGGPGPGKGACCFEIPPFAPGLCQQKTLAECNVASGNWSGPGTSCPGSGPNEPFCTLVGACCGAGTCLGTMNESACATSGGTSWVEGEACPVFACPAPDPFTWLDYNGEDPDGYLPDFDQNNDFGNGDPLTCTDQFYNGPVAVADSLWWLHNAVPGRGIIGPAAFPPDLIQDLALRMATDGQTASPNGHSPPYDGTFLDDLRSGVRNYITANGLTGVVVEQTLAEPSYAIVSSEALLNRAATLQLGFYRVTGVVPAGGEPPTFIINWRRTGGQYVTVAGTNVGDLQIGVSDPDADAAEDGGEGRVRGADHDHDGDGDFATSVQYRETDYDFARHNIGKSFASQDAYDAVPAFIQDAAPDQWQLAILGDPFAYAAAQEPCHAEDAGGAFNLVSSSIVDADFLTANGYADPAVGQIYTVVEAALILGRFGDTDGDLLLDLVDQAQLADCLSGPGVAPTPTPPTTTQQCLAAFDADGDGDVDLFDASHFHNEFTGP